MRTLAKLVPSAALVLIALGCAEGTTALPAEDAAALDAAKTELAAVESALPTATDVDPSTAPQPLLARLTALALQRLDRLGADDAKTAIVAALREKQAALKAAIEGGDPEEIRAAKQALDATAARVVVAVFTPRIVPEVIQMVGRQVRVLSERLDQAEKDGRDVTGPRRVLAAVTARLVEARRLLEAGHPIPALVVACNAADFLHTMFHR